MCEGGIVVQVNHFFLQILKITILMSLFEVRLDKRLFQIFHLKKIIMLLTRNLIILIELN